MDDAGTISWVAPPEADCFSVIHTTIDTTFLAVTEEELLLYKLGNKGTNFTHFPREEYDAWLESYR